MKCPYACNIEQVVQTNYEYDDSGNTANQSQKMIEHKIYVECLQEECGAWQEGKCNFNQGVNC